MTATIRHRRRIDELVQAVIDTNFTWDYERHATRARQALREGEDLAVERVDRPRLVDRRGPREGRGRAQRRHDRALPRAGQRSRTRR